MPNSSRITIPQSGLPMVQKSPVLNITTWGLDLRLSTSTHARWNNRYPMKHYYFNSSRPGPLRETDLPLLETSIRYRSSWIGSCTAYGRTNRRSTLLTETARVCGSLLIKPVADAWSPELWSPELSPDGSEVLYTQRPQIFKVDVNSGVRTLLTNFGRNFGGDWFDPAYALPVSPQPELLTTTWGEQKKE